MKKLPITKEAFEKSRYFKDKYGKLEYVSESGKVFKTNKGRILMFKEWTSAKKIIQKLKSGELFQKQMPSLEKAIKKFLDSDGVKGQAGTWVLITNENGDIELYEHYGYLVGTIIDGHMIWRDNKEYYVSETYSDMILKSLYDGGLIDKYALKESTKKFSKESKRVNEGGLFADIGYRMDDGIKGLKKMFRGKPKFKVGDELEWKYPNGDEWYPFVVKDVQWIDGQWRYGDENAGTYRPHGFWRKDEWHPQGWCRQKQGTSESTKKFGRKFKESNERMSDNEAQINDFLEKIGDYLMSDYGVDDVEKYRFGDRIIVEYNGASYYVEVGLTDNQPAQEGTESNPRFKCMENRRSKRR